MLLRAVRLPSGKEITRKEASVPLPENRSESVLSLPKSLLKDIPENERLLVCDVRGETVSDRAHFFPLRPCDMRFPKPELTAGIGERSVTVRAKTPVLAVLLDGSAVFEDNGFLLLPGETRTVGFRKVFPAEETDVRLYTLSGEEIEIKNGL